ncbi:Sporulation-specific transcription factor SpoVIF [Lentibacillus sp. JNUCC-1]|uniref:stage VI sporulation protein F n=1 Tax=Lentibacillus sp. JNUCC-1 TaxID=2654513 RepID=UPI00132647B7|nr:stage VI sporulation protein F [Lentibacillus sp. JNUCC-1]MUV37699.1 Sporulation-specific transcription factor SpoVIF [Lentibacillus sp. JNUCC-1]
MDNLEKKTGVKMNDAMKLAKSLQNADFKDEKTVRRVIRQVSALARKPVSREKEEMMVNAILNNKVPKDLSSIEKMMGKK